MVVVKVEALIRPLSPELPPDGNSYLICRRHDFKELCRNVIAQIESSGKDYGWIVYIARGGKYPAMEIAKALELKNLTFSIAATHYDEAGNRLPEVRIYKDLAEEEVAKIKATGKPGLLVDEMNDSTETAVRITDHLTKKHCLPQPDFAVLHQKPGNMAYSARFSALNLHVHPITGKYPWMVYYWEFRKKGNFEFFRAKIKEWQETYTKTFEDCLEIFKKIGFTEEELLPFMSHFQELQKQRMG